MSGFNHLVRAHVFVRTRGDHYYLDERAARRFMHERRMRFLLIGVIAIIVIAVLVLALRQVEI